MRLDQSKRALVMGVLAGALYGAWAIYANWNHGLPRVARAFAIQFVLSFCSTSFMTLMIELTLARGRSAANKLLAAIGPHSGMITLFVIIHYIAGTPHVMKTIAPSAVVGLLFCIVYVSRRGRVVTAPRYSRRSDPG